MRIAISGSHCSGKSTLIEAFVERHPDYQHEPEAYELLEESYSAEPSGEEFFRQLECHVQQLEEFQTGARVIIERCPVDYIAYLRALVVLNRDKFALHLLEEAIALARQALNSLDAIVLLSTRDLSAFVPEEEDLELRDTVNELLESFLINDELDLFSSLKTQVVDGSGPTDQRLQILDQLTQQR
jgi:lipase chaperone LimK